MDINNLQWILEIVVIFLNYLWGIEFMILILYAFNADSGAHKNIPFFGCPHKKQAVGWADKGSPTKQYQPNIIELRASAQATVYKKTKTVVFL